MKSILIFISLLFLASSNQAGQTKVVIIYTNNTNGFLENCHCPSHPYGALEKRAVIIQSEGEAIAAKNLAVAAQKLSQERGALALRTLQTIRDIAQDPSEKIVIFMPNDLSEGIAEVVKKTKK